MKRMFTAEVKADCYGGPEFDEVTTYFEGYSEGDKESSSDTGDIIFKVSELPPGACIIVEYPQCPECGLERFEKIEGNKIVGFANHCECGFDWDNWVLDNYS